MIATVAVGATEPPKAGLELREYAGSVAITGRPIPAEAVKVWVYEGEPVSARVTDKHIAVDYGQSGVLFDRETGAVVRRLTVADGWPAKRPAEFASRPLGRHATQAVVPGIVNPYYWRAVLAPRGALESEAKPPSHIVVAEAIFAGRTWRAMQPTEALDKARRPERGWNLAWFDILRKVNEDSCLEAVAGSDATPKRFTTADGLASNIVTHLAVCGDSLWAACVDIYDPQAKQWTLGGLCRFDQKTGRWQRVETIDGRPVRWVTAMQVIGDELWVGYREGEGVSGDEVVFGMGVYPGFYRPNATAVVVARLAEGKWTSFRRKPQPEPAPRFTRDPKKVDPPTEYPTSITRLGDKALLFSKGSAQQLSGNWVVALAGTVSLLDLKTQKWRVYDAVKDLDADQLMEMFAGNAEALLSSNRGLHRFDAKTESWRMLDPKSPVKNPAFSAAAMVGDELWLGYGRKDFGTIGQQGLSRYSERTGQWSHVSPAELGTASPVLRIATLDSGEAWVLFGQRPWMGSAGQYEYYQRDRFERPIGLGLFAGGKWNFPVEGPPARMERRHFFQRSGNDLVALGRELVYLTGGAVYVGPKPWKEIVKDRVIGIRRGADGQSVVIIRADEQPGGDAKYQRGVYRALGGEVKFEDVPGTFMDFWHYYEGESLFQSEHIAGTGWVFAPLGGEKKWVVGRFSGDRRYTIGAAEAVWVLSGGQVVRFDRKTLTELAK